MYIYSLEPDLLIQLHNTQNHQYVYMLELLNHRNDHYVQNRIIFIFVCPLRVDDYWGS